MGRTLFFSPSIFAASTSAQMTALPVSARHPPTTRPTYPEPTTVMFTLLREECLDARHDFVELLTRQLREDRQRQHFLRGALTLGKLTFLVAEVREAGLEVQRERIVDRRADATFLEERLQRVALAAGNAQRVLVEDRLVFRRDVRRRDRLCFDQLAEGHVVVCRVLATLRTPRG